MEEIFNFGEKPKLEPREGLYSTIEDGHVGWQTKGEIVAKSVRLNGLVDRIFDLGKKVVTSFIEIGQMLLEIERDHLYIYVRCKYESYPTVEAFALKIFGFSKSTTYNLIGVAKRFCGDDKEILPQYKDYTYSKLVQFLPMSRTDIDRFTPEVTVAEIKELRKGWEKYGRNIDNTWQQELHRVRERAVAEASAAEKKDRKESFLSLLTGDQSESVSPSAAEDVPPANADAEPNVREIVSIPHAAEAIPKHAFKNDDERKEFISWQKAELWPSYIRIPDLNLEYRRMEFANGASVIAMFGGTYTGYDSETKLYDHYETRKPFRLYLQTPEKPEFDMNGTSASAIVEYMKRHKDEI